MRASDEFFVDTSCDSSSPQAVSAPRCLCMGANTLMSAPPSTLQKEQRLLATVYILLHHVQSHAIFVPPPALSVTAHDFILFLGRSNQLMPHL